MTFSRFLFRIFIPAGLFLALLSSCFADRKLGKAFVESPPPIKILLTPPEVLYKYNHKGEAIPGFDSLTAEQQDSALYASSRFIREVRDSLFLENYVNNFLEELRGLGFTVYLTDATDSALRSQPQVYVLNMAQLQLDEYYYPFEDEAVFYETRYIKSVDLNAIDFSVWYEVSKLNAKTPSKTTLYTSHTMTDGIDGSFVHDPFSDEVRYRSRMDTVSIADILSMASNLGKRHAGYFYDFFLNQYIAYHMPESEVPYWYYHYNKYSKRLEPVEEDRFQVLDNQ